MRKGVKGEKVKSERKEEKGKVVLHPCPMAGWACGEGECYNSKIELKPNRKVLSPTAS